MDEVLQKLFSGDMDFRKTETNLFLNFVRAEEGSGEESARASAFCFGEILVGTFLKILCIINLDFSFDINPFQRKEPL